MKIEYMPVSRLVKYNNNVKLHPDEQIAGIAKSIERFGFRQPVVVDRNYVIVIGHGRVMAAKKLGLKEIPVTVIDDLSDDEINALRLVDNKLNQSAWDFSTLEAELSTITGIDMSDFGFEPISETDIEYATRPVQAPEMASERDLDDDGEIYSEGCVDGSERLPTPYTERTPLQATTDYRGRGDTDEDGRRVVGEQSLIEAEGGSKFKYRCPRCKHLFN